MKRKPRNSLAWICKISPEVSEIFPLKILGLYCRERQVLTLSFSVSLLVWKYEYASNIVHHLTASIPALWGWVMAGAAPRSAKTTYCLVKTSVIAADHVRVTNCIICYPLPVPSLCRVHLCIKKSRYSSLTWYWHCASISELGMEMSVSEIRLGLILPQKRHRRRFSTYFNLQDK